MAGDTIDAASSAYGVGKCGNKFLQIFDAVTNQPVYWLEWNNALGAISLKPDLATPLGVRPYYYRVTMVNYPDQFTDQPFDAEVLGCVVQTIISNDAYI